MLTTLRDNIDVQTKTHCNLYIDLEGYDAI